MDASRLRMTPVDVRLTVRSPQLCGNAIIAADMNTAIVTGANTGLGFECARALAETHDWHVVLACRSAEKGREAVKRLFAQTAYKDIEAMTLDLASLESVRSFARDYAAARRPPLRAIVCNAATQIVTGRTYSADGIETTFAVNHLGHFMLVNLMLSQMTPPARIVVVSSGTHDPAQTTGMPPPVYRRARFLARPDEDSKPLDDPQGTAGRRAYTTSKLCNVLFSLRTRAQVARRKGGWFKWSVDNRQRVRSRADAGDRVGARLRQGRALRMALRAAGPAPVRAKREQCRAIGQSAGKDGHRAEIRAHLGEILSRRARGAVVQDSYDPAMAAELWESSAAMVKLAPDETVLKLRSAPSAA